MTDAALDDRILKSAAGDSEIEYYLYMPRSKIGIRTWELKLRNADGTRRIVVVRDYGFEIKTKTVKINPFATRAERNAEIYRLYNEEGISQQFLGNLFNMSQPSVSLIVNNKNK